MRTSKKAAKMYRQGRWGLPGEIEFLFSSLYRRLGPSLAACQKQAQERLTIGFVRARRRAARADTPLEKRTQVWFELQEEISFAHEFLMKMLPENVQIKKNLQRDLHCTADV